MDGLPTREGQYCTAPMCLLYVNANKQLVPIAIQLKQEEGEDNPIFLPSDHLVDWMLAKVYYQSAHAQVSTIIHYASTKNKASVSKLVSTDPKIIATC